MICESVMRRISDAEKKRIETVEIDWFERDKRILRKTASSGEELGIRVDHTLNEGDVLFEDDEKIIAVTIAPCDLVLVHIHGIREMGQCCFELGNRHLPLAIGDDSVLCPYDEPTFAYMKHKGFDVEKVRRKFVNYTECRGHTHEHPHEHPHGHGC